MKIRTGDTVKVLYGKDAGKTGKVLKIEPKKARVVVDGVNLFKKHIKGDGQSKTSEVVTITKSMAISKVMLIDPATGNPTRVRFETKDGVKSRIAVKTGVSVDKAVAAKKSSEDDKDKKESKSSKKTK